MSYINLPNALLLAINDGRLPLPLFGGKPDGQAPRVGLPTGHLYEMQSFDEVLNAYKSQVDFFLKWHVIVNNNAEYVTRELLPLPVVSSTMGGCMEKAWTSCTGAPNTTPAASPA